MRFRNDSLVLGVDLGGTKSAAALMTFAGDVVDRAAARTPADGGPEAIVPLLIDLARRVAGDAAYGTRIVGIGISAGAPADARAGSVFPAPNLPGWPTDGYPLAMRFAEAFGLPVALENDADATAIAEHRFGAGIGADNVVFVTVGTGIGAGVIVDGRLLRGASGAGGEIGHIAVEPDGRPCACGMRGCLEAYASGPSIVRMARENGYGGETTGKSVAAAARVGDPACVAAFGTAGTMIGRGIAAAVMLLNPEVIVLGTMAVHASDLIMPPLDAELRARTWPRLLSAVRVVPAALGDRAQDLAALGAFLNRFASDGD